VLSGRSLSVAANYPMLLYVTTPTKHQQQTGIGKVTKGHLGEVPALEKIDSIEHVTDLMHSIIQCTHVGEKPHFRRNFSKKSKSTLS
jgi:hypothetical protein